MNFSDKLKKLRKEKELTQEELASKIYVSRSLIARYENGTVVPTKENIEKLALFFNVKLSYLLDENDAARLGFYQNHLSLLLEKSFSWIIIILNIFFSILSILPIFKINRYYFPDGTPSLGSKFFGFMQITLTYNNPIVLITFFTCLISTALSIFCLLHKTKTKKNWCCIANYVVFIVNLILIFISVAFSVIYLKNNLYDY